jgi:predicted amidohydrolase
MFEFPSPLQVATLQLPTSTRYQENLDTLLAYLRAHQEKRLIVAPEVFLTSFDYDHMPTAAKFSANALRSLKKETSEQILVLTLILQEGDGFVNQAVVIHKHKVIHKQNKVKLFRLGDEDSYFVAGKRKKISPFEIEGTKVAVLICFELRFKELWKQVEGADVILVPARWAKARKSHLEILSRALAVMNQCYVIVSNSSDIDMASSCAIVSPDGKVMSDDKLESIEGTIDFREIKKMRRYIVMN